MPIDFRGPAKRLDDIDLPRIGAQIGVGEDEIHAVLEVESSGSGFDKLGRPKMLFEPHVLYRNLPAGEKRDRAVREGLAYPSWRPGAYPKDSYPRLLAAMNIDEAAALKAASWGLPQILGENYSAAGYATPRAMVEDFVKGEAQQLAAMVAFIKAKKLDDDLRRHDWAGFAKGYNGAGYAQHNYHGRLAAAFAKWQRIKDTPHAREDIRQAAEKETARHERGAPPMPPPPDIAPAPVPAPKPPSSAAENTTGVVIVAGGAAAANEASKSGLSTGGIVAIVVVALVIAVGAWLLIRKFKRG